MVARVVYLGATNRDIEIILVSGQASLATLEKIVEIVKADLT